MDIVIVSQYLRDIENFENNNSRFVYLAKLLVQNPDNKVEIITSDFYHATKKHFASTGVLEGVTITALHEPGYPKNISLKRFSSHKKLAKNIRKYLNDRKKPDVCYCAVPSLAVAETVAKYCKKNNVKFVVDVQDLWPEAFKMVFRVPVLSNLIFAPMNMQANRIYRQADEVVAVSNTYAQRAMSVNKKCKAPTVVFLGTEKASFDSYVKNTQNKSDGITIAYVGSMSASYDINSVIDAMAKLQCDQPVRLLAMGDGALRESFCRYAKEKGVDAEFTGKLNYPDMVQRLSCCDIAVNPIRKGSAGSIINKVGDYAMAGLPVVNTQECREYRDLLNEYNAGINCECENSDDVAKAIETLVNDKELRKQMADGSMKLGNEKFDRATSYQQLKNLF